MNLARITEPENLKALGLALLLSLVSTIICLILAYPLAMILTGLGVNQSSFIVLIFILPMWMNSLLRIIAWQNLLEKNGVINSLLHFFHLPALEIINTPYAIVLGMVYDFLPFMILPIYNVLSKIDTNVIEAARDKSFGYFYDLQDTASTPFRLPRSMKYSDVFPIHLLCHFPTGCWRNFLFLRNKIAIRLHFLKSYSFAIDNIELLLVLIIRIILSTYKFFPSSYAFFIIST